jgi:hypothetical protein
LWLSSDANPANKARIAYNSSATKAKEWTKLPTQQSVAISLVAGQKYYIEALHKEGNGSDNLAVGWRTPSMAATASPVVIPGTVLSPFVVAAARHAVLAEPVIDVAEPSLSAYPNPFSRLVTISFSLPQRGQAVLELYDLRGVRLRHVYEGTVAAKETITVEVEEKGLAEGMYLLRLKTATHMIHQRLLLQR